ncbi:MAG: CBS domain-containing protein, partial [Caldimonas sp.]
MQIGEICTRTVVTCGGDTSAAELAQTMRDRHVGDVVVVEKGEDGLRPVGIVTDRDLVVQVLARGADAALWRARDMIVGEPVVVLDTELVYDAIWHMRSRSIRRLPVVDAHGHLFGILTADDVARFLAEALSDLT